MTREEALAAVKAHVKNKNLIKHMIAAEACMEALARKFGEDETKWGLSGLFHDIDYDTTADDPARHSVVGAEILEKLGVDPEIVYCVKVHNDYHGVPRLSLMDKALHAVDPLTGLIVASALIHPARKLAAINAEFVLNRFRESGFARGARREQIRRCEEIGLTLQEFVEIGVTAMQEKARELGL
ncbi:MAG: HDIG domain-containing protein [Firmicutes bacterium]|nr:HDIG domain-containing protein [Bacillota bacterium]